MDAAGDSAPGHTGERSVVAAVGTCACARRREPLTASAKERCTRATEHQLLTLCPCVFTRVLYWACVRTATPSTPPKRRSFNTAAAGSSMLTSSSPPQKRSSFKDAVTAAAGSSATPPKQRRSLDSPVTEVVGSSSTTPQKRGSSDSRLDGPGRSELTRADRGGRRRSTTSDNLLRGHSTLSSLTELQAEALVPKDAMTDLDKQAQQRSKASLVDSESVAAAGPSVTLPCVTHCCARGRLDPLR